MRTELVALLVALILLYGCAQGKDTGTTAPGKTNDNATVQPSGQDNTFKELDDFSSADTNITEPDPGDFSFNESQFG